MSELTPINDLPWYNAPDILIGPVLYKRGPTGCYVPDYSRPGVVRRIAVEIAMVEDQAYWHERNMGRL